MYVYEVVSTQVVNKKGKLSIFNQRQGSRDEISVASPLDLTDAARKYLDNPDVNFNGTMTPGSDPEMQVLAGRCVQSGEAIVVTLLRVTK